MEADMSNDFHWGGINGKSLCKAVISDIWMVFAVMVITFLSLGIIDSIRKTPSYTSSAVVAVYPFNKMYTPETSSAALGTVGAVNEVLNSEMFRTGLNDRLEEPADYSLYSRQIYGTFILKLSVSSSSPENAYRILQSALDYYDEISSHLVGESRLEVLTEPDFPINAYNDSKILKYRPLLTLFMGFAMAGFLGLMYAMRKTYKSSSAIQKYYKNVRFFRVTAPVSDNHSRRNKGRSGSVSHRETMRKTALEVLQMLRSKEGRSVFVTSAARNEGTTDVIVSLAGEAGGSGKSVLVVETDPENTDISEHFGASDPLPGYTLSTLLQNGTPLQSVASAIPGQNISVICINNSIQDDFIPCMTEDIKRILEQAEGCFDVILIDGCVWTGSGDDRIWKDAADASLAVCRQDKADFYAIDRMMGDLRESDPVCLGCVLYGF